MERIWNMVAVLSLVALVCIVAFDRFAPAPQPSQTRAKHAENLIKLGREVSDATHKLKVLTSAKSARLFTGGAETVGAELLAQVNKSAQDSLVKLVAFRPQREDDDGDLHRMPYLVLVEGPYPNVLKFASQLESDTNRIALNMVQIASSDGSSDRVNGSFGIVAFAELQKEVKSAKR